MNTLFLLMARHEGRVVLPITEVCSEYFAPMTLPVLLRKISAGDIALPLTRLDKTQKGPKVVHLRDLAEFIDTQAERARIEARKLAS